MTTKLRDDVDYEGMPERMKKLPLDERGYPVAWFVKFIDGKPDFRVMDGKKRITAVKLRLCWTCGEPLGKHMAFVAGPMCGINRTSSEPPSHLECAVWSVKNCPFLTQRQVKRREDEVTAKCPMPGIGIKRQPGVAMIWVTKAYRVFADGQGSFLIKLGEPHAIEWWSHGRPATRAEVVESVESGLPILMDMAKQDGKAVAQLLNLKQAFERCYPNQ